MHGTFRQLEIVPNDEPDLWASKMFFLIFYLTYVESPIILPTAAVSLSHCLEKHVMFFPLLMLYIVN